MPWASTERTAWPASRSGQRSRPKRGCSVSSASGHVALEHGPDAVRGVVDRVALGHAVSLGAARRWRAPGRRRAAGAGPACRRRCGGSGSSGTPSFAAGRPASANSRWSELPLPESLDPAHGAAARADDPALHPRAVRRGAQVERRAAPDLVEREDEAEVLAARRLTRGTAARAPRWSAWPGVRPLLGAGGDQPDVAGGADGGAAAARARRACRPRTRCRPRRAPAARSRCGR